MPPITKEQILKNSDISDELEEALNTAADAGKIYYATGKYFDRDVINFACEFARIARLMAIGFNDNTFTLAKHIKGFATIDRFSCKSKDCGGQLELVEVAAVRKTFVIKLRKKGQRYTVKFYIKKL
jgi:hypothetical protein